MTQPRRISIDFDGVLHPYTDGWNGVEVADESPVPGALEFVLQALGLGYEVTVFSTRAYTPPGAQEIRWWLIRHGFPSDRLVVTAVKLPSVLYLDDRGLRFEGDFKEATDRIRRPGGLRPWHVTRDARRKGVRSAS